MIKSKTAGLIISVCLSFSFTPAKSQVLPKNFYEAKKYARQIYAAYPYSFYCGCRYFTQGKKLVPYLKSCGYQARIPFLKNGMVNNRIIRIEWVMWQQLSGQFFKRHSEFAQTPPVTYNY